MEEYREQMRRFVNIADDLNSMVKNLEITWETKYYITFDQMAKAIQDTGIFIDFSYPFPGTIVDPADYQDRVEEFAQIVWTKSRDLNKILNSFTPAYR